VELERRYDVLVAGGGVAGVAAALEAARGGMRTALVEKTIQLGGLATSGLIDVYLPLCDGNGTQVTFGIAEELLHASIRYGPGTIPPAWRRERDAREPARYRVKFSPAAFALALDELVVEAGVELWLDTLICLPVADGGRVAGLEVETKSGRGLLRARCVVDATGDADVSHRCGAPCALGSNWLTIWAIQARLERAQQAAPTAPAPPSTTASAWAATTRAAERPTPGPGTAPTPRTSPSSPSAAASCSPTTTRPSTPTAARPNATTSSPSPSPRWPSIAPRAASAARPP